MRRWLLLAVLAGCSTSAPLLGQSCGAGEVCPAGATCLDPHATFVAGNDAGCSSGITPSSLHYCSRVCDGGADCAGLGPNVVCSPNGCGPTGLCLTVGGVPTNR
jgi:hypothetical protein